MSQGDTSKLYTVYNKLVDQIMKYHKLYDEVEPSWKLVLDIPKDLNFDDRDAIVSHLEQKVPYRTQWSFGLHLYECYDSRLVPKILD